MDLIEHLTNEYKIAQSWSQRILNEADFDWKVSPDGFHTNINWQLGHLIISHYFHGIACTVGRDEKVKAAFQPRQYSQWYGMKSNPLENLKEKPDNDTLLSHLALVDERCIEIMNELEPSDIMKEPLMPNPVAKTKADALIWNPKHRMYHNGQMGLLVAAMKKG